MNKFAKSLVGVLILAVLLGCQSLTEPTTLPTLPLERTDSPIPTSRPVKIPALNGDWQISLFQSGGIMGISRSLKILSSGEMTLTDLRSNKSSQSLLRVDELSALKRLVDATNYKPVTLETGCADCYIFNIEITSSGQKFQVELNQLDIAAAGLEPLIGYLNSYLGSIGQ
jgi:hypothetical protein